MTVLGLDLAKLTGYAVVRDGELIEMGTLSSTHPKSTPREFRLALRSMVQDKVYQEGVDYIVTESVRLYNHGKISTDYMASAYKLIGCVVDAVDTPVYLVDTRAWKKKILGTSKPYEGELPDGWKREKARELFYVREQGYDFIDDDNMADAYCMAMLPEEYILGLEQAK